MMPDEKDKLERIVETLIELQLITAVGQPIKSGKEANVYRCRSHPSVGELDLALKIHRDLEHRLFRNDAIYWEGSRELRKAGGDTREARALRKGSTFGRRYAAKTWVEHEWEVLNRLWEHGLAVPRPIHLVEGAILMELFMTDAGTPAPPLHRAKLSAEEAKWLFDALCDDVREMLQLDLVHGDLSPYNVLWNGTDYRLIDFPQTVDARFNPHARDLLLRDMTGLGEFFDQFGIVTQASVVAHRLWAQYQQ